VRYTDVLKLYHMSLHVKYSVSVYMWDVLTFWNSITCHSMYNILFNIHVRYWCSETVSNVTPCTIFCFSIHVRYTDVLRLSHVTPCTIFCFNIYVRYTDVLKLYHMSLNIKYSVSICMWDILMFWNYITCHSMYNILFQYACEIFWCSETVSHVTLCTIFGFGMHVRCTDVLKLYHMSLHVK